MQKNYYAIIPADVRYDSELPPNAKLLYGEITALCNEKGYCWAGNSYFSELYKVTNRTISGWINILEQKGYIERTIVRGENKQVEKRIIKLPYRKNLHDPMEENFAPYGKNLHDPIEENFLKNNKSFNNTTNNTKELYIPYSEIVTYLNDKANTKYKETSKKTKDLIKARWNEGFTLEDFKTVIDKKTTEWLKDSKMNQYLRPETLFGTKFESYLNQKGGQAVGSTGKGYEGYNFDKQREISF